MFIIVLSRNYAQDKAIAMKFHKVYTYLKSGQKFLLYLYHYEKPTVSGIYFSPVNGNWIFWKFREQDYCPKIKVAFSSEEARNAIRALFQKTALEKIHER